MTKPKNYRKPAKLSESQKLQVITLYKFHYSNKLITKALGLTEPAVRTAIEEYTTDQPHLRINAKQIGFMARWNLLENIYQEHEFNNEKIWGGKD
jgi:hypothetical protein